MSLEALTQIIINKAPDAFKALLVQTMENAMTWQDFMQRAESVCWVAFPDPILSRVEDMASISKESKIAEKVYMHHGQSTHNTKNCFKINFFGRREREKAFKKSERKHLFEKKNIHANKKDESRENNLFYPISIIDCKNPLFSYIWNSIIKRYRSLSILERIYLFYQRS